MTWTSAFRVCLPASSARTDRSAGQNRSVMSWRLACILTALAALTGAAPAAGSPVLVYDAGAVHVTDDPALPPPDAANPAGGARECAPGASPAAIAHSSVVSVRKA